MKRNPFIALIKKSRKPQEPQNRVNRLITAKKVRVVDDNDEQLGVLDLEEALIKAEQQGLDLVEVAPGAEPPVCRIMDYGQFKYQQSKRAHEKRKNQKIVLLKEIKLRPKTEEHDFQFKLKHALEFLEEGNKVKLTVMFRGREITHREVGEVLILKFIEKASELGEVELPPKMEGRNMSAVLMPRKKQGQK